MPRPHLVGMVHLPPLPGRPNHDGTDLSQIARTAVREAEVLEEGGFDALLLQNSMDRPTRERVDAATIAQLTRVGRDIRTATGLHLGVNVHRNDGPGAVAVAAAVDASFVRVKVHTGAVLAAEGIVTGCAEETLALRSRLGTGVEVWADIVEPTSTHLGDRPLEILAREALDFGLADALIITRGTVEATCDDIRQLRSALPDGTFFVVGGKTTQGTIAQALTTADAAIVGSALKATPGIVGEVDAQVVADFVKAAARTTGEAAQDR